MRQPVTIEVSDLAIALGGRQILSGLSCQFLPGVTALLGHNGAGKTTLIRALCGLLRPSNGGIRFGAIDPFSSAQALREIRANLGWMPQDPPVPTRPIVADVVRYAAWLRGVERNPEEAVVEALDAVNLANHATQRVGTLSGGQRRRVALACAVVGNPAVMLLDEPTVGLDPDERDHFLRAVAATAADRTVVISTHLMEDVLGAASRIVVVKDGSVARSCTIEELTSDTAASDPRQLLFELRRAAFGDVGSISES